MNIEAIKELIRYQKTLAAMNGVQLTSWEALRAGIASTTKTMLKWLITSPAGWAILATTVITGLVKGYDALIGRQEKLARTKIEDLDEDISKYDEEIRSLEELQSKLESAKGNKSELAQIQNELNDAIGETTGLLNGEGKAYDIANTKLKANIKLKKQQRAQAQKDKIKEKKNLLFDDTPNLEGRQTDRFSNSILICPGVSSLYLILSFVKDSIDLIRLNVKIVTAEHIISLPGSAYPACPSTVISVEDMDTTINKTTS